MWEFLGSLVVTFVVGGLGWLATNFIAKPILDFYDLRRRTHEELIVAANIVIPGNVGAPQASDQDSSETKRYERAYEALRRLGAQLAALDISVEQPARYFFKMQRYDLKVASQGLFAFANSLSSPVQEERFFPRNQVETALKLPRTYSDEDLRQIRETMQARARKG
jgi:hypothetical protein